MTQQPMTPVEMHNAIVDMRAQLYALELMVGRLYMQAAASTDDPDKVLDGVVKVLKADIANFKLEPPYSKQSAAEMREKMWARVKEIFSWPIFP